MASAPRPSEKLTRPERVPPSLAQPRKQKVELKPGPVKAKVLEAGKLQSSVSNQPDANVPRSTPSSTSTSHVDTAGGMIETAKTDFADASQHGILAPAPEGSSRIYTLYHQAKELFVRILIIITEFELITVNCDQKFYARGLKLIFTNRKRAREMLERVRAGGPPLTRWETRFINTCKVDMMK